MALGHIPPTPPTIVEMIHKNKCHKLTHHMVEANIPEVCYHLFLLLGTGRPNL